MFQSTLNTSLSFSLVDLLIGEYYFTLLLIVMNSEHKHLIYILTYDATSNYAMSNRIFYG